MARETGRFNAGNYGRQPTCPQHGADRHESLLNANVSRDL